MKRQVFLAALLVALAAIVRAAPPPSDGTSARPDQLLYRSTEAEVGVRLGELQRTEPDLRRRVVRLARANLGQPYRLYPLGELPFEAIDAKPLYSLTHSDCLVFVEHTYAMALTPDWPGFLRLLQRIRYREGRIGVVTRNHFTETDWNPSNAWLVRDFTTEVAGDRVLRFSEKIDRGRFFQDRYHLTVSLPIEDHTETCVPYADVARAEPLVRDGDCIEVVRGIVKPGVPANAIFGGAAWIGHVGLVAHGADGSLHLIHSAEPMVREETLAAFIARETAHNAERDAAGKPRLLGFKFLRLEADPLANLRRIDGPDAPRVTLPGGL